MALLLSFTLVLLMFYEGMTRSVHQHDSLATVMSGTLYSVEGVGGDRQYRLSRRHLGAMNNSRVQTMRLDLGPEVASLDMEVSQDSVWTDDSQVLVRRGEQVEEVHGAVDSSCFLSGRLTSHDGAASLNRCGRLTGFVQAGDYVYEIEETEDSAYQSEFPNVKVTMKRSTEMTSEGDPIILPNEDLLGREEVNTDSEVDISKRQNKELTAEVAVFLDSYFVQHLSRNKGKRTDEAMSQWIVLKWNVIRKVYGNQQKIGFPFTLQLKKVEIWRKDPSYYSRLGTKSKTIDYLRVFCQRTDNKPDYDHKMLYTQGIGESHLGMAYLNGICRSDIKCSLVKAKEQEVKIELHEFGHNIGLDHDPALEPCKDPQGEGGFMGWGSNYRILDCYRRELKKYIKQRGARCMYETNVNLDTLNPSADEQNKNKNKNKKKEKNKNNNGCN